MILRLSVQTMSILLSNSEFFVLVYYYVFWEHVQFPGSILTILETLPILSQNCTNSSFFGNL